MQTPHLYLRVKRDSDVYLWCDKVSRVAWRHQKAVLCPQLLGKAKVTDPDRFGVSGFVHVENVTRLKVSVDHLKTQNRKVT